ncbi:hypothetical protein ACFFJJ_16560 [Fictibacillus phosphorivorans]
MKWCVFFCNERVVGGSGARPAADKQAGRAPYRKYEQRKSIGL